MKGWFATSLSGMAGGREKGLTLVELLAALVISALVVALASRLFLSGHNQFLARVFETDRLSAMVRLKGALHHALQGGIGGCESGRLQLKDGDVKTDLATFLKERFPGADSLEFRCYETGSDGADLVEWKQRFQPQLVEYRILIRTRKAEDWLVGSVLK